MSAALEVQKAIVAALKADATFGGLAGDRIYDRTPDAATDPYSQIVGNDDQPAIETQDGEGDEILIRIDTWAKSRVTVLQIMAAQKAAIHNADLSLDTKTNVLGRLISGRTLRNGDIWFQGIQRYRFITE